MAQNSDKMLYAHRRESGKMKLTKRGYPYYGDSYIEAQKMSENKKTYIFEIMIICSLVLLTIATTI